LQAAGKAPSLTTDLRQDVKFRANWDLDTARQRLAVYDDLQRSGIGLKDLKILRGKILEIFAAEPNGGQIQNPYDAFRWFVKDVEEHYDVKLGFDGKIAEMERSLSEVKQQHHAISLEYSKLKNIYDNANEMFDSGVVENDIVYWNNIIKRNRTDLSESAFRSVRQFNQCVRSDGS
jgi:hypothetical protein